MFWVCDGTSGVLDLEQRLTTGNHKGLSENLYYLLFVCAFPCSGVMCILFFRKNCLGTRIL